MPPCLFPLPLPAVGLCWSWTSALFGKESPFSALVTFTSQLCYLLRWCVVLVMLTNISLQSTEALNAHRWCYLVTTRPGFHAPQHLGTHSVFSRRRCCVELMFHQRPAQSAIHWLFRRALLEDSVISQISIWMFGAAWLSTFSGCSTLSNLQRAKVGRVVLRNFSKEACAPVGVPQASVPLMRPTKLT